MSVTLQEPSPKHQPNSAQEARATAPERTSGIVGWLVGILGRWELGDLTDRDRQRIIDGLFHEGPRFTRFVNRFAALMAMSVLIAVLGLLADSTAVVIGAMLVAPLMTPVLATAAALVMGWPERVGRQLGISMLGALGAIVLSAGAAFIVPANLDTLPGEVLARTSPNLLDLGIALAAGAAGAYSQIRRAASDAITGVAVAVALVPPLAVVGICIRAAELDLALGAFLLFLANVAGIIMSAAITFLVCGLVAGGGLTTRRAKIAGGMRWAAVAVVVMILPLHVARTGVLPPADRTDDVTAILDHFFEDSAWPTDVVSVSVDRSSAAVLVDVVMTQSDVMPDATEVAEMLAGELAEPVDVRLQVVEVTTDNGTADE